VIVRAAGELDMLTTPRLRSRLFAHLAAGQHVVLDLSEVTFLSASGLQVLVEADDAARDLGISLHVTGAGNRAVTRPMEITGLRDVLIVSEVPAARLAARLRSGTGRSTRRDRAS
jgi:anti-anti-sigma factor